MFDRILHHAQTLVDENQYRRAIRWLTPAIAVTRGERRALACFWRGQAYRGLGLLEEARRDLAASINLNCRHVPAWHALADVQLLQGRTAPARCTMEQAVELFPEHVETWQRLVRMLHVQGRRQEALATLYVLTHLAPDVAAHWRGLSDLQWAHGDAEAALDAMQRAVRLEPDNPVGWHQLYRLQDRLGLFEAARVSASRLLELDPGNVVHQRYLVNSARWYFSKKRFGGMNPHGHDVVSETGTT